MIDNHLKLPALACVLVLAACATSEPTDVELREQAAVAQQKEAERLAAELEAMPAGQKPVVDTPTLNCNIGPVTKIVGGSPWNVFACEDEKSVLLVSAPGSPAMPFLFLLHRNDSGYRLTGEGTGSKTATAATYKVLNAMTEVDIAKLHAEARAAATKE